MKKTLSPRILDKIKDAVSKAKDEGRPLRLLFVCLGNICRSPAADGIMSQMAEKEGLGEEITVDSCGFYGGHAGDLPDLRMRKAALQRGYRLEHRSRTIRPSDFDNFYRIFGMDASNLEDLRDAAPTLEAEEKILPMAALALHHPGTDAVPDPYWSGADGFYMVLDLLEDSCASLIDVIKESK